MLNKGHHATPTFLEGTSGLYQRRESPPNVPTPTFKQLAPSNSNQLSSINNNQTPVFHAQYYKHQSNPGSSTQLHSVNFTGNNNNNQNTLQQNYTQNGEYFGGQAPRPSASSISLPMAASNMVGGSMAQVVAYIPQYTQNQQQAISPQRRLSHTPHGNRTVAPRSELSSHSFSSPRQLQVNNYPAIQEQLVKNYSLASSIPHFIQNPPTTQHLQAHQQQRYSVSSIPLASGTVQQHPQQIMQTVRAGSELPHRVLTSSHSIGNVVQHDQSYNSCYQTSADHQALPLSNSMSTHSNTSKYQQRPHELGGLRAASAGSAQSLSAQQQHYILRKHDSASPAANPSFFAHETNSVDLPLPPNWEVEVTGDGYRYYVDHRNKRTSWVHPLAPENLPPGWTKIYDQKHGVVYYNEIERRSQFEHPGLNVHSASSSTTSKKPHPHPILQHQHSIQQPQQSSTTLADRIRQSSSIQSIIQHQKQQQQFATQQRPIQQHHQSQPLPLYQPAQQYYLTDIGSLNIITEEIPDWLRLYGEAPPESDHLLNWSMFKLGQLQQFDLVLRKLYKQEVINTVSKYERARAEINGELLRRFQRS